jgi:hypothetical protein
MRIIILINNNQISLPSSGHPLSPVSGKMCLVWCPRSAVKGIVYVIGEVDLAWFDSVHNADTHVLEHGVHVIARLGRRFNVFKSILSGVQLSFLGRYLATKLSKLGDTLLLGLTCCPPIRSQHSHAHNWAPRSAT